jgi:hypothetical protein
VENVAENDIQTSTVNRTPKASKPVGVRNIFCKCVPLSDSPPYQATHPSPKTQAFLGVTEFGFTSRPGNPNAVVLAWLVAGVTAGSAAAPCVVVSSTVKMLHVGWLAVGAVLLPYVKRKL